MGISQRILVVEDEDNILMLLRDNLVFEGYDVLEAKDGQQAIDFAVEEKPDLIVLDIGLPVIDGWDVCQRLRNSGIPIIVLSARAQDSDIQRGREYGVNAYLKKPCSPKELIDKIKTCLNQREK